MSSGVRRRTGSSLRPSQLLNMYLVPDSEAPDGFARVSRQGVTASSTVGSGPIQGLFIQRGVFEDDLFAISGSVLYRAGTLLGALLGTGPASFAAGRVEMLFTRGSAAYSYNGTNLVDAGVLDDDDNPYDVRAVAYLAGYFIAVRNGTNRFYWSSSQDGRLWDGLDFAAAESSADLLLDAYIVSDMLWLMGEETVEPWQFTGNSDLPFARIEGILIKKGIVETGCACEANNTLWWWGHDHFVYMAGQGAPQAVSEDWLAEIMARSSEKKMFSYSYQGKVFVCVRTDEGTFAFDVALGKWSEFDTYDHGNWRLQESAGTNVEPIFGDDTNGTLWAFDPDNWDDDTHMERRWSAGFPGSGGIVVHNLGILGNPGDTPILSGDGSAPVVEIRSSRDNGKRFGDWRAVSLGAQGRYRQRIEARRWGLFDRQGGYFEFRVLHALPVRASQIYANEPGGGRSST